MRRRPVLPVLLLLLVGLAPASTASGATGHHDPDPADPSAPWTARPRAGSGQAPEVLAAPVVDAVVDAVVVRSWQLCTTADTLWDELNARWTFTYEDLVARDADVLIISDAGVMSPRWTLDEIAAVERYVTEGHGLVASFLLHAGVHR